MGIDATILVVSRTPPPETLKAREAKWAVPADCSTWAYDGGVWGLEVNEGETVYSVDTELQRYFSPGYERGWWPLLRGWIVGAQAACPNGRVYYGGDSEHAEEVTPELLAELDEAWKATGRR